MSFKFTPFLLLIYAPFLSAGLCAQSYSLDSLMHMSLTQFDNWLINQPDNLEKQQVEFMATATFNRLVQDKQYWNDVYQIEEERMRLSERKPLIPFAVEEKHLEVTWLNIKALYLSRDTMDHDSILLETCIKLNHRMLEEKKRIQKIQYQHYVDLGNVYLGVYKDSVLAEACFEKGIRSPYFFYENADDKAFFKNLSLEAKVGQLKCRRGNAVTIQKLSDYLLGSPEILPIYKSYMEEAVKLAGWNFYEEETLPVENDGYIKYIPPAASSLVPPQIAPASNARAHDGSIVMSVQGSMNPFVYYWDTGTDQSNTLSNVGPGTYCVTITDFFKCCSLQQCIKVGIRDPLLIAGLQYKQICFGNDGSLQVVLAHDGTPPYKIQWDNGDTTTYIHDLAPGEYCVKVTDSAAHSADICFTIKNRISIFGNLTQVYMGKMLGSIESCATGGQAPYTYVWNNGVSDQDVTNLNTGNYSVTVTDQTGCTNSQCFTVSTVNFQAFAPELVKEDSVLQAAFLFLTTHMETESKWLQKIKYRNLVKIGDIYLKVYKDREKAEDYFVEAKKTPFYLYRQEELYYFKSLYVDAVIGQLNCRAGNYPRLAELESTFIPSTWPDIVFEYDYLIRGAGGRCVRCEEYQKQNPIRGLSNDRFPLVQDVEQIQIIKEH